MDREMQSLVPDVIRDIAGRLHNAGDFVCLHAVCKSWRGSHDGQLPLFQTITTTQFLPWLLAATDEDSSTPLRFRCIFSKSNYRMSSPGPSVSWRNWVDSPDVTAVQYLTVDHLHTRLHDPLTGEVTHVPQFPFCLDGQWDKDNPHGIVYGDGTIILYNISNVGHNGDTSRFRAALLRRGDAKWTLVERTLQNQISKRHGGFCATYNRGRILVLEDSHWRMITPDVVLLLPDDVLIPMPGCFYRTHCNYVLQSRGELLWVSFTAWTTHTYQYNGKGGVRSSCAFSVMVHMLEEEASSAPTKMRWVRKDSCSLADRVLFLGSPNSFAIDASRLGGHGGCAYLVYSNPRKGPQHEMFGVFRYNLVDGETEFLEAVPPRWDNQKCTWLIPQPAIAPIQEITTRAREALELKQKKQKVVAPITGPTSIM